MKNLPIRTILFSTIAAAALVACGDGKHQNEEEEEAKVGKVYDPEHQGIDHENRDNQFYTSRNDNTEGQGQETGAPTDTTDVDDTEGRATP